ncbi:HNH endonuclease [Stenotrophomonas sp. CFBP 13724]|uniref:HNH endonuclease n=1 Tax=Stenotrophomonas sp. CFBP 13724 TaxID=2775298 RepID=UPI00177AA7BC|nr:HNH endonuclease [Stenotrophomonas sp. CFBP 13724]MBD8644186.1 HNH endonuclease [Stenotrophomonas sp. CFBP 13724]
MDDWNHEQLAASVEAYRWMQGRVDVGLKVNKAQLYRELSLKHGRTPKAWEYRMQNISHVLQLLDEDWLTGLTPAKNVGSGIIEALIKILDVRPPTAVSGETLSRLEEQRQLVDQSGFFLPGTVEDQRDRVLASVVQRQGQREFRRALLQAYRNKCAITDCGVVDVLEAAHIYRYMGRETNIASNGLLLRADVHTLFDLRLISIDSSAMRVCVAPTLAGSEYWALSGKPFAGPSAEGFLVDQGQLARHRASCNW